MAGDAIEAQATDVREMEIALLELRYAHTRILKRKHLVSLAASIEHHLINDSSLPAAAVFRALMSLAPQLARTPHQPLPSPPSVAGEMIDQQTPCFWLETQPHEAL